MGRPTNTGDAPRRKVRLKPGTGSTGLRKGGLTTNGLRRKRIVFHGPASWALRRLRLGPAFGVHPRAELPQPPSRRLALRAAAHASSDCVYPPHCPRARALFLILRARARDTRDGPQGVRHRQRDLLPLPTHCGWPFCSRSCSSIVLTSNDLGADTARGQECCVGAWSILITVALIFTDAKQGRFTTFGLRKECPEQHSWSLRRIIAGACRFLYCTPEEGAGHTPDLGFKVVLSQKRAWAHRRSDVAARAAHAPRAIARPPLEAHSGDH